MTRCLQHGMRANKKIINYLEYQSSPVVKTRGFSYPAAGGGDELN